MRRGENVLCDFTCDSMAGKTGMLVGRWHGSSVHLPVELVIHACRKIGPTEELWHSVPECTGQPAVMR